uniref:Protein quiver n=1 Tax=Parascaris univalens TaxID=6257 RepID=A0A915CAJ5_PARUN
MRLCGPLIVGSVMFHLANSFTTNCYKCASEAIIMNWGRYLPILSDSESTSERSCIAGNASLDTTRCDGACMLLNVTFEHTAKTYITGVMRDCRTKYFSRPFSSKDTNHCTSRMIAIRKRHYNATYCFCNVDYCNGAARPLNQRLRSHGLKSSIASVSHMSALQNLCLCLSLFLWCLSLPEP